MGNFHLEKNNVDRGETEVDICFREVTIFNLYNFPWIFMVLTGTYMYMFTNTRTLFWFLHVACRK